MDEWRWLVLPPYNEYEVSQRPKISGYYGRMPSAFSSVIKERTGLEGYEFQDYLDGLTADLFSNWDLAGFVNYQYQLQADRKRKYARFRTYLLIAMAAVIILPTAFIAFKSALSVWSYVEGWQISIFAKFKLALTAFTDVMGAGFSAFLTAIHYDTLIGVHRIAELVSADYRAVMSKVYGEITRISSALGYGPYTLLLLTQNSKKLIQDVSSTMGMEWDLSEVQWLSSFQDYMTKFSGAAYKYRDNPEALLFDLSRWVERDALNAKGAFMAGLTQSVNDVLEDVENFVGDLVTIRSDINKLVMDLPEKISARIEEAIGPVMAKFDDFITGTYDPYRKELDRLMSTIQSIQATQRLAVADLVDRLKKPGDYLLEIDYLTDEERLDQERKLADLSSREYYRDVDAFTPLSEPASAELAKIREALKVSLTMNLGFPIEMEGPRRPAGVKAKPRETWFVGDY